MYALYALHNFSWKPSEFLDLPIREKAAVIAMIDDRAKREEEMRRTIEK